MSAISIIWSIFTLLFLVMTIKEWKESKSGLKIDKINVGFSDLNQAYEVIRKGIIDSDKSSHRIAAISYFLAFLTAMFSLIISFI